MIKEKLTITGNISFLKWLDGSINNQIEHYIITNLKNKTKQLIIIFKLNSDYLTAKNAIYQLITKYKNLDQQNINIKLDLLTQL